MAGCFALAAALISLPAGAPASDAPVRTIATGGSSTLAFDAAGALYALVAVPDPSGSIVPRENRASARVAVYAPNSGAALLSIPLTANAFDLMVDGSKHLYVLFAQGSMGDPGVTEFQAGGAAVLRSISVSNPEAFALDGDGRLYVASESTLHADAATIGIYRAGETTPARTIEQRNASMVRAIATDASRLYVVSSNGDAGSISVYTLDGLALVRTVKAGLRAPFALAFGPHGEPYVADAGGAGSVRVYSAGAARLLRAIAVKPDSIAVDRFGDLAVAANGGPVFFYSPGSGTPARTIAGSGRVAFDPSGNLYVAGPTAVAVYPAISHVSVLQRSRVFRR